MKNNLLGTDRLQLLRAAQGADGWFFITKGKRGCKITLNRLFTTTQVFYSQTCGFGFSSRTFTSLFVDYPKPTVANRCGLHSFKDTITPV